MSELAGRLKGDQARLDDMLTHFGDVQAALYSGGMGSGELGRGWLESSDVWRLSGYPTLCGLLMRLRRESGTVGLLWVPVRNWYLWATPVRRPVMRKDKKGRTFQAMVQGQKQWRIAYDRPAGVDERRVVDGLAWLEREWPEVARYRPETVAEIGARLERSRLRIAV